MQDFYRCLTLQMSVNGAGQADEQNASVESRQASLKRHTSLAAASSFKI
jgi:hypothetical protein